jgi:hypothetical protein
VLNARQARWAEELSSYDFVIEHVKGKENVVADALSRRPDYRDENTDEKTNGIFKEENGILKINTIRMITTESIDEKLMEKLRHELESNNERTDLVKDEKGLMRFNGLLFVPRTLEDEVIRMHHDGLENGHPGITRVMEKVQRSFYFPGMICIGKSENTSWHCQKV